MRIQICVHMSQPYTVILCGIGWLAENLIPDLRKEWYLASIYSQGDEEPVEGVLVKVVGIRCCDALEGDVPECHVMVVIMGYCASKDAKNAYECFGDGDPSGEAHPKVAV